MRVTSKGQVTIPAHIRKGMGIERGSEVAFVRRPDGVVELVRETGADREAELRAAAVKDWVEKAAGTVDLGGLTVDQYMDWIRGPRDDLNAR